MRAADTRTGTDSGGLGHVVVIGGGIAGLAAAHRLLGAGARVTVLESSDRLGGKLHAGEIAGVRVDLGAESMLARRPEAVALAREVGLAERLQPPATASAAIWTRGALRAMPKGHVMGVPGDASALAGVLSEEGLRRVELDRELPPIEVGDDVAVGEYVAARLGREVVDRMVEPLLGGVYAGDAYRISMRSAVPQLFEVARSYGSLTEGVRALQARASQNVAAGPVFMGIEGGVGQLPLAVAESVRARGGVILTGAPVAELRRYLPDADVTVPSDGGCAHPSPSSRLRSSRGGPTRPAGRLPTAVAGAAPSPRAPRWRVVTEGQVLDADAVVVALPAAPAARLLAEEAPGAAAELRTVEYASMALITLAYRRADVGALPDGSGFLVPPVDGRTIKASTFASQKWGWIADQDPELFVLRASVGRYGDEKDLGRPDDELAGIARRDLRAATGLDAAPVASAVTRWDGGLPQYPVGHHARVARVREHVARVPGLAVCGAAYDGVGIPACVASACAAVDQLTGDLTRVRELTAHPVQSLHGGAGE
ncbi:protoporphyrinogen oxidase [Streptomyces aurantiacus]|uniref:Coproporphyrinogen III oxidase n=1 Tax=Streptomyces aurantiacus JA 4570 TaxID=1286094 RepID=S3ZBW0_9ACTN|nr:protoporphyrinogen oxidase [Streptomyces aurantiacus]EPH41191.1 putative protoporphyrinogen oxidase [Streptomyces aurantiacus JA 4570]